MIKGHDINSQWNKSANVFMEPMIERMNQLQARHSKGRKRGGINEGGTADKVIGWLEANGGTLTTSEIIDMFIGHRPTNVNSRLAKAVANGHLVRCGELRKTHYKLP